MEDLSNCRYCSEISQLQGEDPIGTAGTADEWLIVEVPYPWKKDIWSGEGEFKPIIGILMELEKQNPHLSLRLMAIATDKEYSQPDSIRVFYYARGGEMFARYDKQEYIVPPSQFIPLIKAILLQPEKSAVFDNNRQHTSHIREMLVCTHTQWDTACGRFGTPLYEKIRKHYAQERDSNLRVWRTSHFGGHKFAPTLIDFPTGKFWGHLKPEILDTLIYKRGNLTQLKPYYRGWSGLEQFAQIAEREIWLQEGWEWQNYEKSGRIIARDAGNILMQLLKVILKFIPLPKAKFLLQKLEQNANWIEVEIVGFHPDKKCDRAYRAKIEVVSSVLTATKTAKEMQLKSVKQYDVVKLESIARSA